MILGVDINTVYKIYVYRIDLDACGAKNIRKLFRIDLPAAWQSVYYIIIIIRYSYIIIIILSITHCALLLAHILPPWSSGVFVRSTVVL